MHPLLRAVCGACQRVGRCRYAGSYYIIAVMARRRAHTKSRLGCSQCKRRKVKVSKHVAAVSSIRPSIAVSAARTKLNEPQCDEKHPSCFNCSRQGVLCSFLGTRPPSATKGAGFATAVHTFAGGASSSVQGSIHGALGESPCGEQNLPSGELNISNIGNNTRIEFLADGELSTRLPGSWARDLELMHHFCTYTSVTMSHHDGVRHIWKKTIPVEAYDHHYVMHGILSLASLHKAYLLPGKRDEYLTRAAYHHNMGQQNFRALLPNVMEDNWRPIFCFSLIIVAYVCCLPAQSENSSTAGSIAKALELFTVTRGIKATLMPYLKLLSRTDLAPLTHSVWLANVGLSINGSAPARPALFICLQATRLTWPQLALPRELGAPTRLL